MLVFTSPPAKSVKRPPYRTDDDLDGEVARPLTQEDSPIELVRKTS